MENRGLAWLATVIAVTAGAASGLARADTPQPSVERYFEVQAAGGEAASRLFELARELEPVCPAGFKRWSFGPQPFPVAAQALKVERANQLRDRLIKEMQARPGEMVFVAAQVDTPFAAAGVQRGDRLAPAADAPATAEGPMPMAELRAYALADVRKVSAQLAAQPERRYTLWRGDQSRQIEVRAVPVCGMLFVPVDSRHSYAGAEGNAVYVTLPLLAALSPSDLRMVLAHEAAHVVLGSAPTAMAGPSVLSGTGGVVGALSSMRDHLRRNLETGAEWPGDSALIAADRLALQLLRPHGIAAKDYLALWRRLTEVDVPLGTPAYGRTRPLTDARADALRREIEALEAARPGSPASSVAGGS